jgi:hypothetical protein
MQRVRVYPTMGAGVSVKAAGDHGQPVSLVAGCLGAQGGATARPEDAAPRLEDAVPGPEDAVLALVAELSC